MKPVFRLVLLAAAVLGAGCASRGRMRTVPSQRRPVMTAPLEGDASAPAALTATAAPQEPAPLTITVQSGNSLWRLAKTHLGAGHLSDDLAAFNHLDPAALLQPGQVLRLPPRAASPAKKGLVARVLSRVKRALGKEEAPKRANKAYAVGEKLTFAVQCLGVTAGYATLSVTGIETQSGRDCYHIQGVARTHPFVDKIFKVQDLIDSFVDRETLLSWRYEKHLREGNSKTDTFFIYDQARHKLVDEKGQESDMAEGAQDVLSCFYFFRTLDLKVGGSVTIPVAADDKKSYELKVDVLKREKVSVLAGSFDTLVVQPHLKFQGVFQQKGDMFIWVTDDARHIPVKIQSRISVGSIYIILQDAEWVEP